MRALVVADVVLAGLMIAGAAVAGWAGVGQGLGVKAIVVGAALTVAVLGAGFVLVVSQSRPHDANIGAGLLLLLLVEVLIGTPVAVVSARRRREE